MRAVLITLALCVAPAALAQTPIIPITPGQDLSGLPGYYGSVGSYDCTSNRQQASAERAIEVCTQVIDSNADRDEIARAFIARGDRYEDLGQTEQANADFERSLALYTEQIAEAPRTPQGYVGRSWANMRLNRFQQALADATFASEVDDGHGPAFYLRGQANFLLGNYQLAAEDFDRTARIAQRMASQGSMRAAGGSPSAYVNPRVLASRCEARAAAMIELGIAETACRAATRNSPGQVFSRGFLRFKQGRYEEAWADFNAAHEDDDTDGFSLYGRGVAAIRLGRQAEGEADIARAREIEAGDLDGYVRAGLVP